LKPVRIHPGLLKDLKALTATERREIGARITEAQAAIGQPHRHLGLGLRKLRDDFYEIRLGLKRRLIFQDTAEALVFEFLGTHDEARRFLRG
jgi:mRNA-degrading endonuclease RelE of RelBE toxin-antitoxin system